MIKNTYDVVIIGGGPAGLSAASAARKYFKDILIIERKEALGGILLQCIHDGFGLTRYKEELTGPEYAFKEIAKLKEDIDVALNANVYYLKSLENDDIEMKFYDMEGVHHLITHKLILANGCRERSNKEIAILGTNPAGVYSAGEAQYLINILGKLPGRRCLILGSGDIGLIMARRLTLEGAKVIGVYEIKNTPSGLERNIVQCLKDYDIPLHLSMTVSKVHGRKKLEAVSVVKVDENMKMIASSEEKIACDALIISSGLIPMADMTKKLNVLKSPLTKGPIISQNYETNVPNVFVSGNALHVHNLVDDVSYTGERAAYFASLNLKERKYIDVSFDKNITYVVPQRIDINNLEDKIDIAFRVKKELEDVTLKIKIDDEIIFQRKFIKLLPPEMVLLNVKMTKKVFDKLHLEVEENKKV